MTGPNPRPPAPAPSFDRGRRILAVLLAWSLVSAALLVSLRVHGSDVVALQRSVDAGSFEQGLRAWQEPREALCGIDALAGDGPVESPGYGTLRCQLFVDSLGLVPGVVGLLLLFSLGLSRGAGLVNPIWRHVLCGPAVAAGLFDIAENGMTGRALEDYQRIVLSDATVLDVNHASLIKWGLYAVALLCVAGLAWATARRGIAARPRWLQAAAVAALLAGGLMLAGALGGSPALLRAGVGAWIVTVALVAAWRWRSGPVPG